MPHPPPLDDWTRRVATAFPDLPPAHARGRAEWSFGSVLAHACGLATVSLHLAAVVGPAVSTVRQRLRERYLPADHKPGADRTALDSAGCCGPLVRWATAGWADRRVAVALDVTNLGDRFHVLTAAVVCRGCGIPVARAVLAGGAADRWHPHWGRLLDRISAALGGGWAALVLTDRGLESAALFRATTARGWHPLMRAKAAGSFRPAGWHAFHPLGSFAARAGARFAAAGVAYRTAPLACPLLACRVAGCDGAWRVLTDLPGAAADPCWYALRSGVEPGFEVVERGGPQWQRTRTTDPARAERRWVAVAVATTWRVEVGGVAESEPRAETIPPLGRSGRPRIHRLFRVGLAVIIAGLRVGPVRSGQFVPEPWPTPEPIPGQTEDEFRAGVTYP